MTQESDNQKKPSGENVTYLEDRRGDKARNEHLARQIRQKLERLKLADASMADSIYALTSDQMHILAASRSIATIAKGIQARQYAVDGPCENDD